MMLLSMLSYCSICYVLLIIVPIPIIVTIPYHNIIGYIIEYDPPAGESSPLRSSPSGREGRDAPHNII